MLVNSRRLAFEYRDRLNRAITHAENQGRLEVAEAFYSERTSLEYHIMGVTASHLDELEIDFPIDPPFEPRFPTFLRNL